MELLYLDNAATSFPKPVGVARAVADCITQLAGSPGRSASAGSRAGERIVWQCRQRLVDLLNAPGEPGQFVFTLNTTDALNLAIKGVLARTSVGATPGDAGVGVLVGAEEHNSVMRPVHGLRDRLGRPLRVIACPPETMDPALISGVGAGVETDAFASVRLAVVSLVGNVTGAIHDVSRIAAWCKVRGVPLLIDAAQAAGHVPMDLRALDADMVAFAGHKGLMGPMGVGVLWVRPGFESQLATVREGGTGTRSESAEHPAELPWKYEAGTPNLPGIAGLSEGLAYLLERGMNAVRGDELAINAAMAARLGDLRDAGYALVGPTDPSRRCAVFSFTHATMRPQEIAAILESAFGIVTRAGLHCAPAANRGVATLRVSFGAFNGVADVDRVVCAMREAVQGSGD